MEEEKRCWCSVNLVYSVGVFLHFEKLVSVFGLLCELLSMTLAGLSVVCCRCVGALAVLEMCEKYRSLCFDNCKKRKKTITVQNTIFFF